MPIPFIMPKFDMDQEDATISSWEKCEGDFVKQDETVLVVETAKVAIDVPAPATGVLAGIRHKQGETVPVTTVIAYILKEGETLANLPHDGSPLVRPVVAPEGPVAAAPAAATAPATPLAVRVAKENGVDISWVRASGDRIRREDVERYLAGGVAQAATAAPAGRVTIPATPAARRLARETGVSLDALQGSGPNGRVQAADVTQAATAQPAPAASGERAAQVVRLEGMRQRIAGRMAASFHDAPHISLTVEADASALEQARQQLAKRADTEGEAKVTLTVLLVKLAAWALGRNPYINASLQGDEIYLWQDANIGVATALPEGLIVPVLHGAGSMSIRQVAAALADVTGRARAGKLALADVQHGTFTISNLGMFGIRQFRAIINPPESAILAVGELVRKPVVINERDEVAVRPMLTLTLSADHRVVDGVVAARFLQDLVQAIETPALLMY